MTSEERARRAFQANRSRRHHPALPPPQRPCNCLSGRHPLLCDSGQVPVNWTPREVLTACAAAALGAALWLVCTSGWNDIDAGTLRLWVYALGIAGVAFTAGAVLPLPHPTRRMVTYLVAPGAVLAGWTTPRGDGDGLWMIIYFILAMVAAAAIAAAELGRNLGRRPR